MFELYEESKQLLPIKVWLDDKSQLEPECLAQALNLSNLPFLYKWAALMPDTHCGYGMPIGGVIASENTVIPNAVGVDIGCGMAFIETNLHISDFADKQINRLIGQLMRNIPTGFEHHKTKKECVALDAKKNEKFVSNIPELSAEINSGYYQVGTLGGGNHFIEIQEDENKKINIMLHSGSRNFGLKVCSYFNELAKDLNKKNNYPIPQNFDLACLKADSNAGQDYIDWMNLALDFAAENRAKMIDIVKREIIAMFPNAQFTNEINAHHNYASLENHYGKDVWIHRKGAISAQKNQIGIIPGAMGSYSYIVRGLGNSESFNSCSHGAGRRMSRKQAQKKYTMEETLLDLKEKNIVLGKQKKKDVSEESRFAYKDIELVIAQESDLAEPIKKLKTLAVIKG